jgi:hypothetical protein
MQQLKEREHPMTSKFKAFGLVFVAALALTAVTASSASAFIGFTVNNHGVTTLHGTSVETHVFTPSGGSGFGAITCEVTWSGTVVGTSVTSITLTPSYVNCHDTFGRTVDIVTNSLHYIFTVTGTNTNPASPDYTTPIGNLHKTGHIQTTVTTGGTHCTITISAEQTQNTVTYHNHWDGSDDMLVTIRSSETVSTTSGGFFACGISNGEHTDGEFTADTLLGGTSGGASISITADGT